ncbi:hypothetical protein DEHRE_01730 [Dehalobacter restrictus DSM 9455]|uniref:Uncharacterized protein n=1 Tax=Dehalobacter restrictus (strain DSM 9455 / PER-K23) TaxID=871738 RepID=A0ABM5P9D0_DEHRP|nr:hypothetical protein DEHRE_01730 [Dehalobacter restrictus DSM 9455]
MANNNDYHNRNADQKNRRVHPVKKKKSFLIHPTSEFLFLSSFYLL